MKQDCTIIQFAKFPRKGAVKTRLQPYLGEEGCYDLHIKLLTHTNQTILSTPFNHVLALDQLASLPDIDSIAVSTPVLLQQGHDLGERMKLAVTWGLKHSNKVIIVGSDCPALNQQHFEEAAQALNDHSHVFIPAEDGGYVLIGATECDPDIYENMPWGTDQVMAISKQRLQTNQKTFCCLQSLWDVDREEDYRRLIKEDDAFTV